MSKENEPKFEVDFFKTLEAMKEQCMAELYAKQQELFELSIRCQDSVRYSIAVSSNLEKLKMDDQITVLKMNAQLGEFSKQICEKYNLKPKGDAMNERQDS